MFEIYALYIGDVKLYIYIYTLKYISPPPPWLDNPDGPSLLDC